MLGVCKVLVRSGKYVKIVSPMSKYSKDRALHRLFLFAKIGQIQLIFCPLYFWPNPLFCDHFDVFECIKIDKKFFMAKKLGFCPLFKTLLATKNPLKQRVFSTFGQKPTFFLYQFEKVENINILYNNIQGNRNFKKVGRNDNIDILKGE